MGRAKRISLLAAPVLAVAVVFLLTHGIPEATPNPPGTFSFGVLGDVPAHPWEAAKYRRTLRSIEIHDLGWVLHVGDFLHGACSDERYLETRRQLEDLGHPVVYTPGDNEWRFCPESDAQERLNRLREVFFDQPGQSLGAERLALAFQAEQAQWPEFVENARWVHEGFVFATLHLVGSRRDPESGPGSPPPDPERARRRLQAATAWMKETFSYADSTDAPGVVLGFHADPGFGQRTATAWRQAFEPFLTVLEMEVERFRRPVLAVHGDRHEFVVDRPLVRRATGEVLRNFVRLQVPGSPQVGWIRVFVTAEEEQPFWFERQIVPWWKYW